MSVQRENKVLIVGAGCFGISTAYHLLKRGFTDVTIVDRSTILPAPDAASTDLNKVVRTSYADVTYTKLAREAISLWKSEEWDNAYHESGVLVFSMLSKEAGYANTAYDNDVAVGARLDTLKDEDAIRSVFPPGIRLASFTQFSAYFNHDGGWANATQGVSIMISKVSALGGKIICGKAVDRLLQQGGRTVGVHCLDGSTYKADVVVLAMGSWTASSLPDLNLEDKFVATGQTVATIELKPEEAALYRNCPVVLNFDSGFYMFPPNDDHTMKLAIHAAGYTHRPASLTSARPISTPRTILSHAEDGLRIPKTAAIALREHLRDIYPDLSGKPFKTRMCWYTDSPDGDWVIGFHPSDPSLMLATAGSGHAYKFLPVIGRLVADAMEGILEGDLAKKFALDRNYEHIDRSRLGNISQELDISTLCSPEDLCPAP